MTAQRRSLPWEVVEKDYVFETQTGPSSLAGLFDGRSQLLVYHFMFDPADRRRFVRSVRSGPTTSSR